VRNRRRGSTEPVAFTLILPILLLLVLCIAQVALWGFSLVVAEAAAREGLRAATVGELPDDRVQAIGISTGVRLSAKAYCDPVAQLIYVVVDGEPISLIGETRARRLHIRRQVSGMPERHCQAR
jgi:hypothetical protein